MKLFNALRLSVALVIIVSATSCTKDYTCQCTIKYSGAVGMPDSSVNQYPIKDTKKAAKSACEGKSATYTNGGVTTIETCQLY